MIVKFIFRCLSILVRKGFLLLMILDNRNIANIEEIIVGIECEVENVENWHWYYWDRVNESGTECNLKCSFKYTCTLYDVKVTSNCTSDNATVYPARGPLNFGLHAM